MIAKSLAHALEMRKEKGAIPLAGGTDLMVRYKSGSGTLPAFDRPVILVGALPELKGISRKEDKLVIGAAETLADIACNPDVPELLRAAAAQMASPAIRNTGTIGGNICNASPAGDTLPPLYALDASVTLTGAGGTRTLPISRFILGPKKTALSADELLTAVAIPMQSYSRWFCRKVGTRKAAALSKLSVAAVADISEGRIQTILIAAGAVAPTVVRCPEAEALLTGRMTDEIPALLPGVLKLYEAQITPIDDQRSTAVYRKTVTLHLIEDFIRGLAGGI